MFQIEVIDNNDLWKALESKRQFTDWKEYVVSLRIAKHIAER